MGKDQKILKKEENKLVKPRPRWNGDYKKDFREKFKPFVTTPDFIDYEEASKVGRVKLDLTKIKLHHPLIHAMWELNPKFNGWAREKIREQFEDIGEELLEELKLNKEWLAEWSEVTTNRFMNLSRDVNQGLMKSPTPQWVR